MKGLKKEKRKQISMSEGDLALSLEESYQMFLEELMVTPRGGDGDPRIPPTTVQSPSPITDKTSLKSISPLWAGTGP